MRWVIPLSAFLALSLPGVAADAPRDVAALLKPIRERHDLPALGGAIVTGERLVALGVDGVRQRGKPEAVTTEDLWHLGSCTKSMTATLIAGLVEEKKLTWRTTIGDVFGDVKGADPAWKDVTLELLLTNHSGTPTDLKPGGLWARLLERKGTPVEQRRALVEGVLGRPPEAKPGTKYIYSNAGFAIAGAIAETVMKEPWEVLIKKRLFDPLGMASAGFGAPGTAKVRDQPRGHAAQGYSIPPGPWADNPVAIGPAGVVHSTLADWAKYVQLHVAGERKDRKSLLKPETFVKLHAPVADEASYAMGWRVVERAWGGRVLTHDGSNTMWYCVTWLAPDKDFAVLVTCNQAGDAATKGADEAAWALIQDHLRTEKRTPK